MKIAKKILVAAVALILLAAGPPCLALLYVLARLLGCTNERDPL